MHRQRHSHVWEVQAKPRARFARTAQIGQLPNGRGFEVCTSDVDVADSSHLRSRLDRATWARSRGARVAVMNLTFAEHAVTELGYQTLCYQTLSRQRLLVTCSSSVGGFALDAGLDAGEQVGVVR